MTHELDPATQTGAPAYAAEIAAPRRRAAGGCAPRGMWWVAWRQHRLQIAVLLGVMAALAAALLLFRAAVVSAFADAGCDRAATQCNAPDGNDVWYNNGFSTFWALLHLAMMAAPIVLGAFAGAPPFSREFAHGTHVLALTQSVGRLRWWAIKSVVMLTPLLAGLLALGFLMEWVDNTVGYTAHGALEVNNFAVRNLVPAAFSLAFFAIAVAAGIVIRSTVAALAAGLIVATAALAGLLIAQPALVPMSRTVTPFTAQAWGSVSTPLTSDRDVLWRGGGYLDASGKEIPGVSLRSCFPLADTAGYAAAKAAGVPGEYPDAGGNAGATVPAKPVDGEPVENSSEYQDGFAAALVDCGRGKGIASSYTDFIPGSMLWPMRWNMVGICIVLSVIFLAIGAARMRWAVAKR